MTSARSHLLILLLKFIYLELLTLYHFLPSKSFVQYSFNFTSLCSSIYFQAEECGRNRFDNELPFLTERIIGGDDTKPGEIPWMASVRLTHPHLGQVGHWYNLFFKIFYSIISIIFLIAKKQVWWCFNR